MRDTYWYNGMMGTVIGDALGLPVQFMYEEEIASRPQGPVTGMEGGGCYDMPKGAWSDDSSMALAILDSINRRGEVDPVNIMDNFVAWRYHDEFTPTGEAFDMGNTCDWAIYDYTQEHNILSCGKTGEYANGNGALMRTMPVCLWAYQQLVEKEDYQLVDACGDIKAVARLTHNHERSNVACEIYFFLVKGIIEGRETKSLLECLQAGMDQAMEYLGRDIHLLTHVAHYLQLRDLEEFRQADPEQIEYSGYVVKTLEAAIYCLLNTNSFQEALLEVVNHGDDSDTVGAVAGGLAGLYYGKESFPEDWVECIIRREWIEEVIAG